MRTGSEEQGPPHQPCWHSQREPNNPTRASEPGQATLLLLSYICAVQRAPGHCQSMLWEHTTGCDPVKSARFHTGCCEHPQRQNDAAPETICFRQQNDQFLPWPVCGIQPESPRKCSQKSWLQLCSLLSSSAPGTPQAGHPRSQWVSSPADGSLPLLRANPRIKLQELPWEPLPTLSTELVGCWWSRGAPGSLP